MNTEQAEPRAHTADDPGELSLICTKCTREGRFLGESRAHCAKLAQRAGWLMDGGKVVCEKCPARRA
jgi:hypothetical protein